MTVGNATPVAEEHQTPIRAQPNLLTIPQELRDQIYDLTLVDHVQFIVLMRRGQIERRRPKHIVWPSPIYYSDAGYHFWMNYFALSSSCHQLRLEASDCFFGRNSFILKIPTSELSAFPDSAMRKIKELRLETVPLSANDTYSRLYTINIGSCLTTKAQVDFLGFRSMFGATRPLRKRPALTSKEHVWPKFEESKSQSAVAALKAAYSPGEGLAVQAVEEFIQALKRGWECS